MSSSPQTYYIFILLALPLIAGKSTLRSGGHGSHGTVYYPKPQTHSTYPGSTGLSGNDHHNVHTYPGNQGLSGSGTHHQTSGSSIHQNNVHSQTNIHKNEVHHHYHYAAPQTVTYGAHHYPVYHAQPPVYVYEYRNSGSRFDTLLAGLALYNLGKMSARHNSHRKYTRRAGETCLFEIKRSDRSSEKTRIDCRLMSSFIWEEELVDSQQTNSVHSVTTTNTTTVNGTTVSTTSTVVDALQAKGPSIEVTQGMSCFIIRMVGTFPQLRKKVECDLLQTYSRSSFNSAIRVSSAIPMLTFFLISNIACRIL